MHIKCFFAPLLFATFFSMFPSAAFAYVDPGSVSMVISGIISAFVACSIVVKKYWYKIKTIVQNKKTDK